MSYIYENYGKPEKCECGNKRNVGWFSKSGINKEEREDWISLCSRCLKDMRKSQKEYKVSLEELKGKRELKGKELSEIENKITNNNYDEIVKQRNKTIQENKAFEENNYKLGVEIEKKKAEIKETENNFNKREKQHQKIETKETEAFNTLKEKSETKKKEIENSKMTIKNYQMTIEMLSKDAEEFSNKRFNLETEIKNITEDLLKASKIISEAGETKKLIEEEKNAIQKREHKADIRERSLIRKYKKLGINITKF